MTLSEFEKRVLALAGEEFGKASQAELRHAVDDTARALDDALEDADIAKLGNLAVIQAATDMMLLCSLLLMRARSSLTAAMLDRMASTAAQVEKDAQPKKPRVKRRKDGAA